MKNDCDRTSSNGKKSRYENTRLHITEKENHAKIWEWVRVDHSYKGSKDERVFITWKHLTEQREKW